ncbi:trigger factor [Opitutia bacterium ISCC 51]|nr:trigger factor [Opitutae bacterium ISCC 51]QXD26617.1 trigger factor [Opitutae bacterium ISCC 52]
MSIQVEEVSESRKKVIVSVDSKDIAIEQKKLLGQFSQQVRIPGFRPGKAPEAMILKKYGKDVAEELKRKVVSEAYEKVTKHDDFKVFNIVDMKEGDIESGKDASIEFTVDVDPEFDLPEYKGIAVTVPEFEVTEKDIEETVYTMRSQRADFVEKEDGAAATDYVQLGYEGFLDDKPLAETLTDQPLLTKQASTWEEAGTDRADFPGLAEGLVGLKKGDEKEITVNFPDDFRVEDLQGKTVVYKVNISEVREKKLPELDEEFLKANNAESEEQLRENVERDLTNRKQQESDQIKREQIINFLSENSEVALPQSAVESEAMRILQGMLQQQAQSQQADENPEATQAAMKEEASKQAERRVKVNLILNRVAEAESIQPEDQDFQMQIFQEAMYTQQKPEQIAKELRKDQARLRSMHESILINKTLDFLVEQSSVSETIDQPEEEKK